MSNKTVTVDPYDFSNDYGFSEFEFERLLKAGGLTRSNKRVFEEAALIFNEVGSAPKAFAQLLSEDGDATANITQRRAMRALEAASIVTRVGGGYDTRYYSEGRLVRVF